MKDFKHYLDATGEIGFVEKAVHTLSYVSGIPKAKPNELILFETGEVGQVLALGEELCEVLLLSKSQVNVGTRVARTQGQLKVEVSEGLLGRTVDPLGIPIGKPVNNKNAEVRKIDVDPPPIGARKSIDTPLETGVTMVDLVIPLGKGQRQLVIGDRKTGKTPFLLQASYSAAASGAVAIYAAIAKKRVDIKMIEEYFRARKIEANTIIVASSSADPTGQVFLTPYTAMTIAEYFRNKGREVLIVLDDMTAHAKYYREISLLAHRFPGRSSYPGDIFYIHSKLLERAGNFLVKTEGAKEAKPVAISALPVAELVMGDLSGFIQTNLMAMTDGHIYFDIDRFNAGRRPPINPFLSVTRVGRQAQTPLLRDASRELTSFLVHLEDLKQFMHFGAELGEKTKKDLALGERLTALLDQATNIAIPRNINVILLALLWAGFWSANTAQEVRKDYQKFFDTYQKDAKYKVKVDNLVNNMNKFSELVDFVKSEESIALGLGRK